MAIAGFERHRNAASSAPQAHRANLTYSAEFATGGGSRACVMVMNTISNCSVTTKGACVTFIDLDDSSSFDEMYRREYPALVAVASALSGQEGPDLVYPASDVSLTSNPPVDLREDPDVGLWTVRALNPMNNFQIPRRTEPGEYQICRDALTAEMELCADLTTVDPTNAP